MDKNVLIQYCDMKEEIKDLRRRITETERQIWKIAEEGTVKDTVSGGMGGEYPKVCVNLQTDVR